MPDLPKKWAWPDVRAECNPKEIYYDPFAEHRAVYAAAAGDAIYSGKEAVTDYKRIRARCPEDTQNLETRIRMVFDTSHFP